MSKILLSIHPEHVEKILLGKKKYEFRKTRCRDDIKQIIIYATSPRMRVVAEVEVTSVIEGSPQEVWLRTCKYAGVSESFFNQYYKGCKKAVAYELGEINIYSRPKLLAELGISHAPQNFLYL